MRTRRHHNNKGYRQIKSGGAARSLAAIAKRLGIPSSPKGGAVRSMVRNVTNP